jgi:hypothetical protein
MSMRTGLLIVAGLLLVAFIVVAVVLPRLASAEVKAAAQSLISGADSAKLQVAAAAEKSGNVAGSGNGVKLAPKIDAGHGELKWIVEQNGAIRGWNEKNAIEIALTPALQGGKVSWTCRGFPNDAMPANCGGR